MACDAEGVRTCLTQIVILSSLAGNGRTRNPNEEDRVTVWSNGQPVVLRRARADETGANSTWLRDQNGDDWVPVEVGYGA